MLHAQRRWPDAINTHLWPYALKAAVDSRNNAPTSKTDECPISIFCGTTRPPYIRHRHHFGCPTYVLKKEIQDGMKAKKWTDRTRIGINLGYSSRHAHSVSLIMNLETGLVSPQYHCHYDDMFETTTGTQARSIPRSKWQIKAGFIKGPSGENEGEEDEDKEDLNETEEEEIYFDSMEEQKMDDHEEDQEIEEYITRSGRTSRPPERLSYVCYESIMEPYDYDEPGIEDYLLAYKASSDPDIMYYHQAMKEPDKDKFQEAIVKLSLIHI